MKKMAAVFRVVGAGRLLVSLCPVKRKFGCLFRVVRWGSPRSSP